ncbi:MAG: rod shape-determining protein MreC [Desulfobia sp.]
MHRRSKRKNKNRRPYILSALIFILILIVIVSAVGRRDLNTTQKFALNLIGEGQFVFHQITSFCDRIWSDYLALWEIREKNKKLQEKLNEYKTRQNEYREAIATNQQLRRLLKVKESISSPTLTASIVGRDPSLWFRTIIINRGSAQGLERGMAVNSSQGVVGHVLSTSPDFAKVLLANDPNCAIDVLVQKNRVHGISKGAGDYYDLRYIPRNCEVSKDDIIVTSGLAGVFPKGIPVGTVSRVTRGKRGMFQEIRVKPAIDFSRLEEVIVILQENSLAKQDILRKYNLQIQTSRAE